MNDGGEVELESGFPYETIRALMDKGHHVTWARRPVRRLPGDRMRSEKPSYIGASESRKDGQAAGY